MLGSCFEKFPKRIFSKEIGEESQKNNMPTLRFSRANDKDISRLVRINSLQGASLSMDDVEVVNIKW